jgi:hypothetical protein
MIGFPFLSWEPAPSAQTRAGGDELLATLRLSNSGEARPIGLPITTAIPFARGLVRDAAELGFDVPGEAEALERHGDGSIRWARIRVLPSWKAAKATFVEVRRGGKRPEPPAAEAAAIPTIRLVLEDLEGTPWTAVASDFQTIAKTPFHEVLRAVGPHRIYQGDAESRESRPAVANELLRYEILVERFPGAPFFLASIILRNDPPSNPVGAIRFRSYRLEWDDPKWKVGVGWARENGCALAPLSSASAEFLWLLPPDTKNLWLGDGQTKAWRLVFDPSGDSGRFRALTTLLERPILPGLAPADVVKDRVWGDLGDMVLGPPPQTAGKLASNEWTKERGKREYGWCGPWGDVKDTHQTGSPRNGLSSQGALRTISTGFREWFDLTWEEIQQHALRPIIRGVRAADHPDSLLFEGMPHPKWRDRLGREKDPDPRFARFREGTSGSYRQETHGWNGFDEQHFTIDDLYAMHLFTGDPWVRSELEAVGEALLTYDFAKKAKTTQTSRGDGWCLRGFCLLHRALGDPKYLDAARNLVQGMEAERSKGAMKFLHDNAPDPRHIENHPFEIPWQVAIAIDGLAAYHELTSDPVAKNMIVELADFLVKDCWNKTTGTFYRAIATDGSGVKKEDTEMGGTQSWIPSALVAAHRLEPKPEYMILSDAIYKGIKNSNASFERGGIQYTWWQSYLRDNYDREGIRRAIPESAPVKR